jgi:hypothetical protein
MRTMIGRKEQASCAVRIYNIHNAAAGIALTPV